MAADAASVPRAPTERIELSVPLRAEFAATIRTLAASVGADLGFSIDEIDDVRLGISEVFSVLVDQVGDPTSRAHIDFDTSAQQLEVSVAAEGYDGGVELDDLAAGILHSVTDGYVVGQSGVTLTKHAVEGAMSPDAR